MQQRLEAAPTTQTLRMKRDCGSDIPKGESSKVENIVKSELPPTSSASSSSVSTVVEPFTTEELPPWRHHRGQMHFQGQPHALHASAEVDKKLGSLLSVQSSPMRVDVGASALPVHPATPSFEEAMATMMANAREFQQKCWTMFGPDDPEI